MKKQYYTLYVSDNELVEFAESNGMTIPAFANLAMHKVMSEMQEANSVVPKPVEVKDLTDRDIMVEVLNEMKFTRDMYISQGNDFTLAQEDIIIAQFSNRGRRIGNKMIKNILPWQI